MISRRIYKRYILVLCIYTIKETAFEFSQGSDNPLKGQIGCRFALRILWVFRRRIYSLGKKESMLSIVVAVTPCAKFFRKRRGFFSAEFGRLLNFPPCRLRMKSRKSKPVGKSIFLQICKRQNSE